MKTMKKFFYAALAISAAAALVASCEKEADNEEGSGNGQSTKLARPVLSVEDLTGSSFTVTWTAVENADSYTYALNNGTEHTTTATSAEFTSLAPDDYTVKVKATSGNSSYADSDWAETQVTITLASDETFDIEIYLTDDYAGYGFYKYNSFWYIAKGKGVTAASYACYRHQDDVTDDEIIADLESGGSQIFELDQEKLELVLTTGFENGFVGLSPETTYDLAFYVTFQSGARKLYREAVTTGAAPVISDDIQAWLGTWNITSDKSFQWLAGTGQESVIPLLSDTPKTGTLTIEYDPMYVDKVVIKGFSGVSAMRDEGYDILLGYIEDGQLVLYNGIQIGNPDEYATCWYAFSDITYTGGQMSSGFIAGSYPAFTFTLSGNTAVSEAGSGNIKPDDMGTGTFTVLSYDIYLVSGQNISVCHDTDDSSYAGKITLTKTSASGVPAQAKLFGRTASAYKPSIPSFSAMKVNMPVPDIL